MGLRRRQVFRLPPRPKGVFSTLHAGQRFYLAPTDSESKELIHSHRVHAIERRFSSLGRTGCIMHWDCSAWSKAWKILTLTMTTRLR